MLVIGENLNASNKSVGQAIGSMNRDFIETLAKKQDAAGADFIDVNVGLSPGSWGTPEQAMEWFVETVQSVTRKPLTIDSETPGVIAAGLSKYRGDRVMINSVNAEVPRLQAIGRLAAERQAYLVALAMGDAGIPKTVEERLAACDLIMKHLNQMGISEEKVLFDPLVLPVCVDTTQAVITLKTIEGLKARFPGAGTIIGLSNVSYGLPQRDMVNRVFLMMASAVGLDAAILNPLDARMMSFVKAARLLTGKDTGCRSYMKAFRAGELVG
jgi:5-methyltetrahydrofolate corrinoid/iron sulfur protein methyltransferase